MCGICGIYNFDGAPVDRSLIKAMKSTMIHRGPDGHGTFIDKNIALGHRRLSIIDLESGHQPMASEDGRIQVVFNGEIYNFLELKKELESRGHKFRTKSDTESIIHGYEEWGVDVIKRLRGMFAIGLWDGKEKSVLLARDRIGKKPLFYFLDDSRLIFASELKAILCDPTIKKEIDPRALDCYLSYGHVPSPMCILKDIKKLPPAHLALCKQESFIVRRYWRLEMGGCGCTISEEKAIQELEEIFDEAVKLRLISDVPLGAFLSGGVDSSAVVAAMARITEGSPVRTTSIGFSDKRYDEIEYARVVAARYNTDHKEFVVKPDALEVVDKLVWHLDEPFADSSAIPTYYVSKMTRKRVTVALSGDGGDETFAGYVQRYYGVKLEERLRKKIPEIIQKDLLKPISRIYPKWHFLPRPLRLANILASISESFEQSYFRIMSFYFAPETKKLLYSHDLSKAVEDYDSSEVLTKYFKEVNTADPVTKAQYVDIMTYLPEDILVKVDRMSMANSLEVRAPILDHKLIELVAKYPSTLKLKGNEGKYIFKKMNEKSLPKEILYRKKQGFCVPLAPWLRGGLRDYTKEILFSPRSGIKDYFNIKFVKEMWDRHNKGWEDLSASLWSLIMFELWRRKFIAEK